MPLSKERMRERKKQDRARIRFDKQLSPLTGANDVKPKPSIIIDKPVGVEYIDADGYSVYDD